MTPSSSLPTQFLRPRSGRGLVTGLGLLLFIALFGATSAGCASKPTMKLNHAEVSGVRIAFPPTVGVLLTIVLDVYNPNSYDVAIRAMRGTTVLADRYTLPIDWRPGGEGVWMAAGQTTSVRVPITVPVDLALTLLRESFQSATVSYHVTGSADVTATRTFKIEKDNYAVDETGTFARQQLEMAMPHF